MRNLGIATLAAASAFVAPVTAMTGTHTQTNATTWYYLDMDRARCVLASNESTLMGIPMSSPQELMDTMRQQGVSTEPKVERNTDGSIYGVIVSAHFPSHTGAVVYFTSIDGCLRGKTIGETNGTIVSPNELR